MTIIIEENTPCMNGRAAAAIAWASVRTADGRFLMGYSEKGLCALHFPNEPPDASSRTPSPLPSAVREWHALACAALKRALAGKPHGNLPPLDLSAGTGFQRRVWKALLSIKPGQTSHYGKIAREIGTPGASRAVGSACGANPVPVFVPCHRVLAVGGKIGGFSGGLHWKQRLLEREGSMSSVIG